ncbi:hypothetical protein F5B20DRAFT_540446 [Whalleya microplaca]|nr:hypothetical protein F5B20DRAFT_540446 [Whalleya microplaca]
MHSSSGVANITNTESFRSMVHKLFVRGVQIYLSLGSSSASSAAGWLVTASTRSYRYGIDIYVLIFQIVFHVYGYLNQVWVSCRSGGIPVEDEWT